MKRIALSILSLFLTLAATAQTVVIDGETHRPLGGVMVFTKGGSFIEFTDSLGHLSKEVLEKDSIILQHLAYKSIGVRLPKDTIAMMPTAFNIKEVSVTAKADYIKLRGYYREYSVANDAMLKYEDGMVDYYIPINGGKTRAVYLMSRQGLPTKSPLCTSNWVEGMDGVSLNAQTTMQYIARQREKSPRDTLSYVLTDTLRRTVTAYRDKFGNDRNHTLTVNLMFYKAQLTDDEDVAVYEYTPKRISQLNLISFSNHMKWWDKIHVGRKTLEKHGLPNGEMHEDDFSEFYVVERDVVSKEQLKAARKNAGSDNVECVIPESVPQLSDRLLEQLGQLKEATRQAWKGTNVVVPTKDSK